MTIYFGLLHFMRYYVVFSSYLSQVVYFEAQVKMEEKEVQKGEKMNQISKPNPKYKNTGVVPVTDVTEAVTSVTPCTLL